MDWQSQLGMLGIVILAGAIGSLLGIERELARKPAGLRTHIFVAAAAALIILLGDRIIGRYEDSNTPGVLSSDPVRVIQSIVIGISFLGAGTVVRQSDDKVEGLTTAASILFTACLGMAVGIGEYLLAIGGGVTGLVVLTLIGWFEKRSFRATSSTDGAGAQRAAESALDTEQQRVAAHQRRAS